VADSGTPGIAAPPDAAPPDAAEPEPGTAASLDPLLVLVLVLALWLFGAEGLSRPVPPAAVCWPDSADPAPLPVAAEAAWWLVGAAAAWWLVPPLGAAAVGLAEPMPGTSASAALPVSPELLAAAVLWPFPVEPFPVEPFPVEPFPVEAFPVEAFPVEASPAEALAEPTPGTLASAAAPACPAGPVEVAVPAELVDPPGAAGLVELGGLADVMPGTSALALPVPVVPALVVPVLVVPVLVVPALVFPAAAAEPAEVTPVEPLAGAPGIDGVVVVAVDCAWLLAALGWAVSDWAASDWAVLGWAVLGWEADGAGWAALAAEALARLPLLTNPATPCAASGPLYWWALTEKFGSESPPIV
jgi:hypothetical protein